MSVTCFTILQQLSGSLQQLAFYVVMSCLFAQGNKTVIVFGKFKASFSLSCTCMHEQIHTHSHIQTHTQNNEEKRDMRHREYLVGGSRREEVKRKMKEEE